MARPRTHEGASSRHVSLVALPDAVVSTLFGIFDVMNSFTLMRMSSAGARPPFLIDIVGEAAGPRRWRVAWRSMCRARSKPSRRATS